MKVAILGCGYWASFQVEGWKSLGVEVVACYNRTTQKAVSFAKKHDIPMVFNTPEELFSWGQFDLADIITEVMAHEELTLMAAKYKKDVICQKPMSFSLSACEKMVKTCKDNGIFFAVHENFRYQYPSKAFIDAVKTADIGDILFGEINMRSPDLEILKKQPALATMPHMALRDIGPHAFDILRCAFGEISSVYAVPVYSYKKEGIDVADTAICNFKAVSGAVISCNLKHDWNDRFIAVGTKGKVVLDNDNILHVTTLGKTVSTDTKMWQKLSYIPDEDWFLHGPHIMSAIPLCLEDLKNSYEEKRECQISGEDNLKTMKLVFAAIDSFDTGKVIDL